MKLHAWFLFVVSVLPAAGAEVTFTRDVAPVLYRKCAGCHHPDDIAPMSFLDYRSVRPWAPAIREAVLLNKMPPWFADPHAGRFSNDPSLTGDERRIITRWVEEGAPEGKREDLPAAPVYTTGWHIGKPDAVFDIGEDHTVKSVPADEYIQFTVPTNFSEGHWVRAVEILPGNRKLVHHAHVVVLPPADKVPVAGKTVAAPAKKASFSDYVSVTPDHLRHLKSDAPVVNDACAYAGPEIPGLRRASEGALVSYLPGMPPDMYPDDTAKWVPAGSRLRFVIHYHAPQSSQGAATGKGQTDRTQVGLVFAERPPAHPIKRLDVDNNFFSIPAGEANEQVRQCATFDADSLLLSFTPHMHYRGKDARFEIQRPGEAPETLLYVPKYDFNWQLKYRVQDPVAVPKGTRLIITVHYDNSRNNAFNPDPQKTIRWGEPSEEEMMSGWIDYIQETRPAGGSR